MPHNIFSKRRSERDLINELIPLEDMREIIKAGELAPIARGRYDTMRISVYEGAKLEEIKKEYLRLTERNPFYDCSTFVLISQKDEIDPLANQNAGCMIENMLLEAADRGVGGVYVYSPVGLLEPHPELANVLGISDGYKPIAGAIFGKINVRTTKEVKRHIEIELFTERQTL